MSNSRSQSLLKHRIGVKSLEIPPPFKIRTPSKSWFESGLQNLIPQTSDLKKNIKKNNSTKPAAFRQIRRTDMILKSRIISPQAQLEIKEAQRQKLNKSRIRLDYLKHNLTKSTCNLSILDFWTNEMLANTIKLIHKPAQKVKIRLPVPTVSKSIKLFKNKTIKSKNSFSNLDDYIKKIDNICNSTSNEMKILKSDLEYSMSTINKLN